MPAGVRKLALTAHLTASVGWLGSVTVFLALAVGGLASADRQLVSAMYLTMEYTAWFVIAPLSLASLFTGLLQALGTPWGLFRHYWVLAKLGLNLFATGILVLYLGSVSYLADRATETGFASGAHRALRVQAVVHAGAALLLLLAATGLSVYKPRGRTRYGWRKQQELRTASRS